MSTITNGTSHESTSRDNRPHYVFYEKQLVENIENMNRAFKALYSNFQIAYSFKTNYLRRICEVIASNGCLAEVVSPQEFAYAKKYGLFKTSDIVYNGVIPDPETKFNLARYGGYVNVDNIDEYRALSKIAAEVGVEIEIGIRLNFAIGNGLKSRFGVDIDGDEFKMLIAEIQNDPYVYLAGFHCHIGTARPSIYWRQKADTMVALAKKHLVKYIDLGGGMYGPMPHELAVQFTDYAQNFDEYAYAVCLTMKEAFPNEECKLIVEPGTALVGNTMNLVAHVTNVKDVRGMTYVTVDTCSNHLGMICECRDIPATCVRKSEGGREVKDATIAGCTCLEFDYIKKNVNGVFNVGDVIIFHNVGAYSIGASRQFIVPRPAVYDYDTGEILRHAETSEDMFYGYLLQTT